MANYHKSHGEKQGNKAEYVSGGAGEWEIRPNGKFYDRKRKKWVIRCEACKRSFYAARVNARTCSNACRTARSRRLTEVKVL